MELRWTYAGTLPTRRALATAAAVLESVAEPSAAPAVLVGARLEGDSVVLGEWQRAGDAVRRDAVESTGSELLRRRTGGPTTVGGDGIYYAALALRHASVLMSCPPDRVLNRNVRGVLGGLSASGTPAHYFGREWLSVDRRPAALATWDRLDDGRVLLEFFVGVDRTFVLPPRLAGYPKRKQKRFLGKKPVTLAEAWDQEVDGEQMTAWIAQGHPDRFGSEVEVRRADLTDEERERAVTIEPDFDTGEDDDRLRWSRPREIPIGFLSAGARLDDEGRLAEVRVAGDFFQDRAAPRVLSEKLVGQPPDAKRYVDAINSTWDGTSHVIEGLKELEPIRAALTEAAPPTGER